jgi:hypothetical protein
MSMSAKRELLVEILEEEFKYPETHKRCVGASRDALKEDYSEKRVFDDFPDLIPENDMITLSTALKLTLENARTVNTTEGLPQFRQGNIDSIQDLENFIIKYACDELLDETGHVKARICELLEWKEKISQLKTCSIVSAFVGHVNLALSSRISATINDEKYTPASQAFYTYVNRNIGSLIKEKMENENKIFNAKELAEVKWPLLTKVFTVDNTKTALKWTAVGFTAGMLIFKGAQFLLGQYNAANEQVQSDKTNMHKGPQ